MLKGDKVYSNLNWKKKIALVEQKPRSKFKRILDIIFEKKDAGPDMKKYLEYREKRNLPLLCEYQIELAEKLLEYRRCHFKGGLGSGRTYLINDLDKFIHDDYFYLMQDTKEI